MFFQSGTSGPNGAPVIKPVGEEVSGLGLVLVRVPHLAGEKRSKPKLVESENATVSIPTLPSLPDLLTVLKILYM